MCMNFMHSSFTLEQQLKEVIINVLPEILNKIQWYGTGSMTIMLLRKKSIVFRTFTLGTPYIIQLKWNTLYAFLLKHKKKKGNFFNKMILTLISTKRYFLYS